MELIVASPGEPTATGQLSGGSGNAAAILHEIATCLADLAVNGSTATIDLLAIPLTPGDHRQLEEILGQGAVVVQLTANGVSDIYETLFPGAWRVIHRNEAAEVVADLIEVCRIPDIVTTPIEDLALGVLRLEQRLSEMRDAR